MANAMKTSCPVCQSASIDIAYWIPRLALGEILVHQRCQACPATWTGLYVLRAIHDVEILGQCAGRQAPPVVRLILPQ
jgi:hypothetical protein